MSLVIINLAYVPTLNLNLQKPQTSTFSHFFCYNILPYLIDKDRDLTVLLEDWVTSILHAKKGLELLESRNGLYLLYMDRVTGELAKRVGQVSSLQNFKPDIFNALIS